MKKFIVSSAALALSMASVAQQRPQAQLPDYMFETVVANPVTPVKNQYHSGTCWAFSTIGFVESEVIRINGITDTLKYPDFSEFFVVSHSYKDRAVKYVRLDGNLTFGAGSEGDDVLDVIRDYGIVPQAEMTGMNYGTEKPEQAELDAVLKSFVKTIVSRPNKTLSTAWSRAYQGILDAYLGKCPEKFTVDGKEYTPSSYRDALHFNPDDYVTLTSFTHHPFYTKFALELADNWRSDLSFNLPIDELTNVIDAAINAGYTLEWAADVSQWGFTRNGMAVLLDKNAEVKNSGSDQERWVGKAEVNPARDSIVVIEKNPTQESRQLEFDNKTLTDDHGMLLYGIARDQNGKKYYIVKNSWGEAGKYKGIWYATEAFLRGQTISVTVHRDALPNNILKKLGL